MTTDRELLEGAARACGKRFAINGDDRPGYIAVNGDDWRYGWAYWNPLDSDSDAFRLMVDCGIDVVFDEPRGVVCAHGWRGRTHSISGRLGADKGVATRLAITRAAAAMSEGREG